MKSDRKKIISMCKELLLEKKTVLLNQYRDTKNELSMIQHKGDEADRSVGILTEHNLLSTQERLRNMIYEIEFALAKMEKGVYGICEETEENIESERLLAIPWTRVSIEGAEIREQLTKKFAPI